MGDFVLGGFGPMGVLVLGDYIRWDFILGDFILGDLVRERYFLYLSSKFEVLSKDKSSFFSFLRSCQLCMFVWSNRSFFFLDGTDAIICGSGIFQSITNHNAPLFQVILEGFNYECSISTGVFHKKP